MMRKVLSTGVIALLGCSSVVSAQTAPVGYLGSPRETREEISRMIVDGSYSPAEISAAKIRLDDARIPARRAAVRLLATIDFNYDREAETGLIAALRCDRVEAVRLEAARALGDCRGVTVRILDALNLSALGLDTDGHPAEISEAVRLAAGDSLNRCLMRGIGDSPSITLPQATPAERRRAETVSTTGPQAPRPRAWYSILTGLFSRNSSPQP